MGGCVLGGHRIRHYGLLANGAAKRAEKVACAWELIAAAPQLAPPPQQNQPAQSGTREDTILPQDLHHPCSHCGCRMVIVELFEAGCRPRHLPSTPATIGINSSRRCAPLPSSLPSSPCGPSQPAPTVHGLFPVFPPHLSRDRPTNRSNWHLNPPLRPLLAPTIRKKSLSPRPCAARSAPNESAERADRGAPLTRFMPSVELCRA